MRIALLLMIAGGLVIGLALPGARHQPTHRATTSAAAIAAPIATTSASSGETVIRRDASGHFLATASVNSEPIRFVVDTGATEVALTEDDARRAHIDFDPARFAPVARGAGGNVGGQIVTIDRIELDGRRVGPLRALVLADLPVSLLGQSWLRQIGSVSISNDEMRLR
ncbi:TIGR02281 family clan AA aspartic protease [uncultured Sphingomonas sp.]|uniref:retropepsin-like aspartic protease family protein n=1 Tax=uncultured Sphingomonas sp. TaxID=158754 RepID=UPI00260DED72|nr:TIGR02281 family clan AA aspartic protease [uncultured Sphingomonas sp.]